MNKVILMGRLTRDAEIRYGAANNTAIARFSIAVDRRYKREGQPTADFFDCRAFGKLAEFVEKYLRKGTKIVLEGEIQNNNYTNKDGQMVYGMQIIAGNIEFAESKASAAGNNGGNAGGGNGNYNNNSNGGWNNAQGNNFQAQGNNFQAAPPMDGGFMDIPDGIEDDGIPFV